MRLSQLKSINPWNMKDTSPDKLNDLYFNLSSDINDMNDRINILKSHTEPSDKIKVIHVRISHHVTARRIINSELHRQNKITKQLSKELKSENHKLFLDEQKKSTKIKKIEKENRISKHYELNYKQHTIKKEQHIELRKMQLEDRKLKIEKQAIRNKDHNQIFIDAFKTSAKNNISPELYDIILNEAIELTNIKELMLVDE